jgi:hypothetical protein
MSLMKAKAEQEAKHGSATVPSAENYHPCRTCHGSTPRAMLSQYGGLCNSCYGEYCRAASSVEPRAVTRQQKIDLLHSLKSSLPGGGA